MSNDSDGAYKSIVPGGLRVGISCFCFGEVGTEKATGKKMHLRIIVLKMYVSFAIVFIDIIHIMFSSESFEDQLQVFITKNKLDRI